MYQNSCDCGGTGLGFITEALSLASDIFGGGSGGGSSGGGASSPVTVSPNISTQISPQISPVFQQQFQPQNSAATAGTAQSVPAMPSLPGSGGGGGYAPGYATPPAIPSVPQQQADLTKYAPYILAALGIVAFVTLKKRKAI